MERLVRGSELQTFLRCRTKWDYQWRQGLKSKKPNGKLLFGSLIHKFLEMYYATGERDHGLNAMREMYQQTDTSRMDQVELNELWELVQEVACNYHNHWWQEDAETETIATELTFAIPLGDVTYTGTIDRIYRTKDGRIWFQDHKSTNSIEKYEKNAILDRQISRYWWAIQQLMKGHGSLQFGEYWVGADEGDIDLSGEIGGFVYNIILKDFPVPPEPLKKGGLSKAKNQKTTYNMYMKALIDAGIAEDNDWGVDGCYDIPEEYTEILDHLRDNPREYFKRVEVQRTQEEIDAAMLEFYITTLDMRNARIYRNITADCHWDCPYKDICLAGLDGSDVQYLTDELFTKEGE